VSILGGLPRSSAGGPTEDADREGAKKGPASFDLGPYEEAAKHYEDAYRLIPDHVCRLQLSGRAGGWGKGRAVADMGLLNYGCVPTGRSPPTDIRVPGFQKISVR